MKAESRYKELIEKFISNKLKADEFVNSYMDLWCEFRDSGISESLDPRLNRLTDRIFTSCDVYDPNPEDAWEIDSIQLKNEVGLLAHIWWGI
jgi:hypothetical protein